MLPLKILISPPPRSLISVSTVYFASTSMELEIYLYLRAECKQNTNEVRQPQFMAYQEHENCDMYKINKPGQTL